MKKYIFITIAAISILAVGCKKEVAPIDEPTPIENNVIEEQPIAGEDLVTYSFTIDNKDLKSILENDGTFAWELGDSIAIYNTTSSSYVGFKVTALEAGVATIKGSAPAGAAWTNAIYPAARAAGSGDAVDYTVPTVAGPILVSKVEGTALSFKYLGAVANIRVDGVPGTPTTLTFTANANVFGNRTFSWSGETPVLGGSGSQASITVPFTNATIISVPIPQESYAGFTITVDNAGGRHLYKKTTGNTFDMTSKKLLPMPALTYVAPTYYVSTESTRVSNTTNIPLIQTSASPDFFEVVMNSDHGVAYTIFDSYNIGNAYGILASGTTNALTSPSASDWKVVGQVNGNGWTIDNKLVDMQYVGNWHFVRGVRFDATSPEFKFFENPSNWDAHSFKGDGSAFAVGVEDDIVEGAGDPNIKLSSVSTTTDYDIFVNFSTRKVIVKLSSDNYFPDYECFFLFSYNHTAGTASNSKCCELINNPFDVADPDMTAKMSIFGDFTGWTDQVMAYNGNHGWSTYIVIASDDTYKFDFRETGTWGWYRWSDSRTASSMFGYSGWKTEGDTGCTINLTAGTYDVYVNAYSYYDNKAIKYCFVKR